MEVSVADRDAMDLLGLLLAVRLAELDGTAVRHARTATLSTGSMTATLSLDGEGAATVHRGVVGTPEVALSGPLEELVELAAGSTATLRGRRVRVRGRRRSLDAGVGAAELTPVTGGGRVLAIERERRTVTLEPGVTWDALEDTLSTATPELRAGRPLAPPCADVVHSALLGACGAGGVRHGTLGEQLVGLEAVGADGIRVRSGSGFAAGGARAPADARVGRAILRVWPVAPHVRRLAILVEDATGSLELVHELALRGLGAELVGITWPALKRALGVPRPRVLQPGEPAICIVVELAGWEPVDVAYQEEAVRRATKRHLRGGLRVTAVLDAARLPALADLGTGAVGAYGPGAGWESALHDTDVILTAHGAPPLAVVRPMTGGAYAAIVAVDPPVDAVAELRTAWCAAGFLPWPETPPTPRAGTA